MKLGKIFFNLLQQLYSFLGKLKFKILDIQIPWRHQLPRHKKVNTFY